MFVSFAITELLAFNLQIFMESRDPDHALFYPLLAIRGGGHEKTSFELWTTIIGPRSTSDKCFKAPLKMHYVGANLG